MYLSGRHNDNNRCSKLSLVFGVMLIFVWYMKTMSLTFNLSSKVLVNMSFILVDYALSATRPRKNQEYIETKM